MTTSDALIELVGTEFVLVNAAAFLLANWTFEVPMAQSIAASVDLETAASLRETVSAQWIATLRRAGLWKKGDAAYWTDTVLKERAIVKGVLTLADSQVVAMRAALSATSAEFSSNWQELVMVAPGSIESYGVGPEELVGLSNRFETIRTF